MINNTRKVVDIKNAYWKIYNRIFYGVRQSFDNFSLRDIYIKYLHEE